MAEILIIEDDARLRTELSQYLQSLGHDVVSCADGHEGYTTLKKLAVDLVIADIRLPGLAGTDLLEMVSKEFPYHPPIILITGHGDKANAIKAVHFGAFDFIEKPFSPESLQSSIDRALKDKKDDAARYRVLLNSGESHELTERERTVALLAAQGLTNDEISQRLQMSSETVKTHLKHIFRKLGVNNRTALSAKISASSQT